MELLKSYAHQVVSYHPENQRDELFAELYDTLCEEFEDWQIEHPEADTAAFLDAKHEHPMKLATRLASEGSTSLIGPRFYFSFLSTLKIGATITTVVYLVLAGVTAAISGDYWSSAWRVLVGLPASLLWVAACILGVFVALEKSGEKATWLDRWSASDIKPMDDHQAISRTEVMFDLAISLLLLLWITDIIQLPSLMRVDGVWQVAFAFEMPDLAWGIGGLLLMADIVWSVVRLVRGFWSPPLRKVAIAFNLVWIAALTWVVNLEPPFGLQPNLPEAIERLLPLVQNAFSGVIVVVILILAWDTLSQARRLWRDR